MEIAIGLEDRETFEVSRGPWREAANVLTTMGFVLLASTLYFFAQIPVTSEAEKWMAPIVMGLTNLMGSIFAFLTAREMRMHDAEKKIMKADLDRKTAEVVDCHNDRREIRKELDSANRKITRLLRQANLPEDDDEYIERRGEPDPDYRGPKRRNEDKPKTDPPKPPLPSEPK